MHSWKLSTKFSLFLVLVFLLGSGLTIVTLSKHLNHQAEQAVTERAEILISALQAARNYTQNYIQPALQANNTPSQVGNFLPESIPNFAAQTIFTDFTEQSSEFQDFAYKEAALNPTNPLDLADNFESQILTQLQSMMPDTAKPLSGYRTKDNKKLFYIARPIIMSDASCLVCHGDSQQAPAELIKMYGAQNGFGWQLNELVATQMIYVPADQIFERGRQNLWTVSKIFLSIFTALFIIINLLLWRTVTHPVRLLTQVAKQISNRSRSSSELGADAGSSTAIDLHTLAPLIVRQDEPGQLARAFEYMVYVLNQREQDLQQAVQARTRSLHIEMHERQVAQDALQTYNHAINHDLRNLVMGISMVVKGVLLRATKTSVETVAIAPTALTLIEKSCDRQLNLMDSLVEVRDPEVWSTVLCPQTVQLSAIAQELQDIYQTKLLDTPHTFKNHIPKTLPAIQADPNQLKRVFENLINNAIKYNPPEIMPKGCTIGIMATLVESANDSGLSIRCTVFDDGIGINEKEQQDLFAMHSRGQIDHKISGDGLGLYICRQIVTAHGGKIGIERTRTIGAEIWFTLPV
ncbi:MAG: DUF3365 domain-containing protein [Cyanobacteria bacterium J06649_4]